jgi:hydrogenase maturation protease
LLKPILILCLGNEIIADDAFGPIIADHLRDDPALDENVEVIFAPVAGFHLLDLLAGRDQILIVDSIVTGTSPAGTMQTFPVGILAPSKHLTTSHQISLPTAIELGQKLGLKMPRVIDVVAVEAEDLETIGGALTPAVQNAVPSTLEYIRNWIAKHLGDQTHDERKEGCTFSRG